MTTATLSRTSTEPLSAQPQRTTRDPWFDNAKMLLVTLVVVGHSWTMLPQSLPSSFTYDFLYLWHVPAFVMITGYLSRSFTWSRRHLARLLTSVVLPYLVFETALTVFRRVVGGEDLPLAYLDPNWPMWYLTALFVWRLVTPVFKRLPAALPAAVAVSLLGGLTTGNTLDLARAMGLLPFFVAGLLVTPEHLDRLRGPAARLSALGVFAVVGLVALLLQTGVSKEWLYWRSSYAELGAGFLDGAVTRLGLLLVGGAAAAAFFALVPRQGGWFSRMGAATLVVYLCHGFVVKGAGYAGIGDLLSAGSPWWSLLWLTAAAVAVALVLAWPPVATRLNLVVDPVGSWKQRRRPRPARHRSRS